MTNHNNPAQMRLALKRAQSLETHKGLSPLERRQVSQVKKSIIKRLHSSEKLSK